MKRKPITAETRERVYNKHNGFCVECGKKTTLILSGCSFGGRMEMAHIDHKVPISSGGDDSDGNMQLLCQRCNCAKRDDQNFDFSGVKEYEGRDYITVAINFFEQIQIRRLQVRYGSGAVVCYIKLLLFCADNQRNGDFLNEDEEMFDIISRWDGEERFSDILIACGLMNENMALTEMPFFKVY